MIENQNAEQTQETMEEQLEIQVTEDPVEPQAQAGGEDELENYTKSVSKRINKLNAKAREAEQRAQQLEQIALQKEAELQQYRQYSQQQSNQVLAKEEEAITSKEAQIDDVYRKAVESGDADLITKAAKLQSDISIQKEKLRVAKARQQAATQEQEYVSQGNEQHVYQQPEQAQQVEQEVEPTEDALAWHERNPWYANKDDADDMKATQYAYYVHYNLANEGYDVGSDEYYEELDSRVGTVYPHTKSAQSGSQTVQSEARPAVQRVSSAPAGGRSKTQGKKNGVSFSKSEIERLRGLKPHNMSEEAWMQRVAAEKKKILAREAS
jgi:preprotein translocase subunit SecD